MRHLVRACALYIIILCTNGCWLMPKVIREAEKPAREALNLEAESKIETDVQFIPAKVKCPDCGTVSDSELAAMITKKDIEKRFTLDAASEGPKFSWWQRILRTFWGMGLIGVVLLIVLFLFAPGILGAVLGRIRPMKSLKKVARGIEIAKQNGQKEEIEKALHEVKMTDREKKRIRKWRSKGKI